MKKININGIVDYFRAFCKEILSRKMMEFIVLLFATLVAVDALNLPSKLYVAFNEYFVILCILIFLFSIIKLNLFELMRINIINDFDFFIGLSITVVLLFAIRFVFIPGSLFAKTLYVITMMLLLIICIMRVVMYAYVSKTNQKSISRTKSIFDLKEFLDEDISPNQICFFEEREVSYDLLSRTKIINDLYYAINSAGNTDKSFVISLTGKWGSGKSTIVNNVLNHLNNREENDLIVIENFNPWAFSNDMQMINNFIDLLLKSVGIDFSYNQVSKIVNSIVNTVSTQVSLEKTLIRESETYIKKLKDTINSFTQKNRKQILFIIDNLERTEADSILTILKSVSTVLNLKNITYLIVYDEVEMKQIFEEKLNINYDYMEKVVQLNLKVPDISDSAMKNLVYRTIEKLFIINWDDSQNNERISDAIRTISKNFTSVRQLKRNLNSFGVISLSNNNTLNKIDSFMLAFIQEINPDLYQDIFRNRNHYISEDRTLGNLDVWNAKEYNQETTDYFTKLFQNENNSNLKEILVMLFPNVNLYFNRTSRNDKRIHFLHEPDGLIIVDDRKEKYKNSIMEKRIYNARFFELYFSYSMSNDFLKIDQNVNTLIRIFNSQEASEFDKFSELYVAFINEYPGFDQKFVLEQLEFYVDSIINKYDLLKVIFKNSQLLHDGSVFLGLNANNRAAIICSNLLLQLNEEERIRFFKEQESWLYTLEFLREVVYWLNPKKEELSGDNVFYIADNQHKRMVDSIIENDVDIFEKNVYHHHILYSFISNGIFLKKLGEKLNERNILYFIVELTSTSVGTRGYGYKINKKIFDDITTIERVMSILKNKYHDNFPSNNAIVNIFLEYDNTSRDSEEGTLYTNEEIIFSDYLDQ